MKILMGTFTHFALLFWRFIALLVLAGLHRMGVGVEEAGSFVILGFSFVGFVVCLWKVLEDVIIKKERKQPNVQVVLFLVDSDSHEKSVFMRSDSHGKSVFMRCKYSYFNCGCIMLRVSTEVD